MVRRNIDEDSPEEEHLLTVQDLVRILHFSRSFIYGMIHRGELPVIHIRHAIRFRAADIEAYIRERAAHRREIRSSRKRGPQ